MAGIQGIAAWKRSTPEKYQPSMSTELKLK